mmetsp:Transcript_6771/g.27661  ORF Transcript_6771/g.27661 Transcript_6771/m.27661 type:complete len:208 (+) Transcript_6771:126-749(+)
MSSERRKARVPTRGGARPGLVTLHGRLREQARRHLGQGRRRSRLARALAVVEFLDGHARRPRLTNRRSAATEAIATDVEGVEDATQALHSLVRGRAVVLGSLGSLGEERSSTCKDLLTNFLGGRRLAVGRVARCRLLVDRLCRFSHGGAEFRRERLGRYALWRAAARSLSHSFALRAAGHFLLRRALLRRLLLPRWLARRLLLCGLS